MRILHVKVLGMGINGEQKVKLYEDIMDQIEGGVLVTDKSIKVEVLEFDKKEVE